MGTQNVLLLLDNQWWGVANSQHNSGRHLTLPHKKKLEIYTILPNIQVFFLEIDLVMIKLVYVYLEIVNFTILAKIMDPQF